MRRYGSNPRLSGTGKSLARDWRHAKMAGMKKLLLLGLAVLSSGTAALEGARDKSDSPNFVVIFCDDLGYGDLGCFGHPTIKTPQLDRMAREGQKWTNFYVAASVCTPSRAGLLTGRLPIRSGMCSDMRRVLFPDSKGGLPKSEITIARALKKAGYDTAAVGKWHLGHLPPYLPTSHGFDTYFGIPYSNDMDKVAEGPNREIAFDPKSEYWDVPLMRDKAIVERPAKQETITKRYTEEAEKFIAAHRRKDAAPFFLYLAHSMPHIPLFRSKRFVGKSARGYYGDVIQEIDWSVGRLLRALREGGLAEKTLVVFTSDNGPWLIYDTHGGSAGLLREGKGSTWEGGMREPTVFWWPGKLKKGVVTGMGSTLDLFPTFLALAGAEMPGDRTYDGGDLSPALFGTGASPRREMFFYRGQRVYAARVGEYKAHFITKPAYGKGQIVEHDPPVLYHLGEDPSEKYDIAEKNPEVIETIRKIVARHEAGVEPVEDQLAR